jgi:hypothetical protein
MEIDEKKDVEAGTDGIRYTVQWRVEENPDFDWIGEYESKPSSEWSISRRFGKFLADLNETEQEEALDAARSSRGCEFFKAYASGEAPKSRYYRKYAMQDFKRAEAYNRQQWCFVGCLVKAYFQNLEVGASSCWGYESDMTDADTKTIEQEHLNEAKHEALKTLQTLKQTLCATV